MKLKKKTAMIISFSIGIMMFTSTAMAEVTSKTGYDELKDTFKYTAESCTDKLSNYTIDMSYSLKDNGTIIRSTNEIDKFDISKNIHENVSTYFNGTDKKEGYYYGDKNEVITKGSNENLYHEIEFPNSQKNYMRTNPFKDDKATDIEKIADALVGNLKDSVVVKENSNGTKEISCSLNETQIPSLVNAAASFELKNQFTQSNSSDENIIPKITKDIFIKQVKENIVTEKSGLIKNVIATGIFSGKDKNGKEHNLTFDLAVKITNVNSTAIKKIDLSGKKVEKQIEQGDSKKLSNPEKFIGKYKSDIVTQKDNKFIKIGEIIIDVEKITTSTVSGTYHENYIKGYESYSGDTKDFKFSGNFGKGDEYSNAKFTGTTSSGKSIKGEFSVSPDQPNIYLNINGNQNRSSNGAYNRIFN